LPASALTKDELDILFDASEGQPPTSVEPRRARAAGAWSTRRMTRVPPAFDERLQRGPQPRRATAVHSGVVERPPALDDEGLSATVRSRRARPRSGSSLGPARSWCAEARLEGAGNDRVDRAASATRAGATSSAPASGAAKSSGHESGAWARPGRRKLNRARLSTSEMTNP
jgi:hypothetical protein